jgi:hypothetical protein
LNASNPDAEATAKSLGTASTTKKKKRQRVFSLRYSYHSRFHDLQLSSSNSPSA